MTPLELHEMMFDDDPTDYEAEPQTAEGQEDANWHNRLLNVYVEQQAMDCRIYQAEIDALKERMNLVRDYYQRMIDWHATCINQWHRAANADGQVKGTVQFTVGPPSKLNPGRGQVEILDEERVQVWAEEQGLGEVVERPEPVIKINKLKAATTVDKPKDGLEVGATTQLLGPDGKPVPGVRFRQTRTNWALGDLNDKPKK